MEASDEEHSAPIKSRGLRSAPPRNLGKFCFGIFLLLLVVLIDSGSIILTKVRKSRWHIFRLGYSDAGLTEIYVFSWCTVHGILCCDKYFVIAYAISRT